MEPMQVHGLYENDKERKEDDWNSRKSWVGAVCLTGIHMSFQEDKDRE
jgi:hypothetical protein